LRIKLVIEISTPVVKRGLTVIMRAQSNYLLCTSRYKKRYGSKRIFKIFINQIY